MVLFCFCLFFSYHKLMEKWADLDPKDLRASLSPVQAILCYCMIWDVITLCLGCENTSALILSWGVVRICDINQRWSALEKMLTHSNGLACSTRTRHPQTKCFPSTQVTISAERLVAGCRSTDAIKYIDHFIKSLASFKIRIWLLFKSCKLPSEVAWSPRSQDRKKLRAMGNEGQSEGQA